MWRPSWPLLRCWGRVPRRLGVPSPQTLGACPDATGRLVCCAAGGRWKQVGAQPYPLLIS